MAQNQSAAQIRRRTEAVRMRFGDAAVDASVLLVEHMLEHDDDDDVVEIKLVDEEESSAA